MEGLTDKPKDKIFIHQMNLHKKGPVNEIVTFYEAYSSKFYML